MSLEVHTFRYKENDNQIYDIAKWHINNDRTIKNGIIFTG